MNPIDLFSDGAPTAAEWSAYWDTYGATLQTFAGLAILAFVLGSLLYAKAKNRIPRWLALTSSALVIAYNSHGMWGAVEREFHLPLAMRFSAFFIAEAVLLFFASKARLRYEATVEIGEDGYIARKGRTGGPGLAVWFIAIGSGLFIGASEDGWIAFGGRVALGVAAAAMWQVELPGNRVMRARVKRQTRWRWTWSRIGTAWGLLEPDEDELDDTNETWLKRKLVSNALVFHTSKLKWRQSFASGRLTSLSKRATPELLDEVAAQLKLIYEAKQRTDPEQAIANERAELERRHAAELEELRQEQEAERSEAEQELEVLRGEYAERLEVLQAEAAQAVDGHQQEASATLDAVRGERDRLAEQLQRTRDEAARRIGELEADLKRLRPAAEQAAALSRRVGELQDGGNGSTPAQAEAVPTQRPAGRDGEPVGSPSARAATNGTAALKPEPQRVPAQVRSDQVVDDKAALFATLNGLLDSGKVSVEMGPAQLVTAIDEACGHSLSLDTAKRYARQWRHERQAASEPAERVPGVRYLDDRRRPTGQ